LILIAGKAGTRTLGPSIRGKGFAKRFAKSVACHSTDASFVRFGPFGLLSDESVKADRVEELLQEGGTISVQILNEFTSVATRKLGLSLREVTEVLETIRAICDTQPLNVDTYDRGVDVAERYEFPSTIR
jgi:hypothetical protein